MNKITYHFLLALIFIGCDCPEVSHGDVHKENKPMSSNELQHMAESKRKCTRDQMHLVEQYFNICKHTSASNSTCMNRGIVMHCDEIEPAITTKSLEGF